MNIDEQDIQKNVPSIQEAFDIFLAELVGTGKFTVDPFAEKCLRSFFVAGAAISCDVLKNVRSLGGDAESIDAIIAHWLKQEQEYLTNNPMRHVHSVALCGVDRN